MNSIAFPNAQNRQLLLNSSNAVKLVNHWQILYIEADDNYSKVFLNDKTEFLLSKTLQVVENEIDDQMFFRCHRSFLINIQFIREIYKGDDMCIILKSGNKIPLSRRRNGNLRKLLSIKSKTTAYSKK